MSTSRSHRMFNNTLQRTYYPLMVSHSTKFTLCMAVFFEFMASSGTRIASEEGSKSDESFTVSPFSYNKNTEKAEHMISVSQNESYLLSLPFELISQIISCLDFRDILGSHLVCHHFCKKRDITTAVLKCCLEMNVPFHDCLNADFQMKMHCSDKFIFFNDTEANLHKVTMAIERGLIQSFQFNSLSAYKGFEEKSLFEEVFVELNYCKADSNFSNIDFEFVDQMNIVIDSNNDASIWLENKAFLSTNWKKLNVYIFTQSYEDFAILISRLNVIELELAASHRNIPWSELLKYSTLETREKVRLILYSFPENLPNVGFYRFNVIYNSTTFFEALKSNGLLQFIQERSLLKEIGFFFSDSSDFETCIRIIKGADFSSLERDFCIILESKSGRFAEFIFSS